MQVMLYDSSNNLKVASGIQNCFAGWNSIVFTPKTIYAAGTYKIAVRAKDPILIASKLVGADQSQNDLWITPVPVTAVPNASYVDYSIYAQMCNP